MTGHGTVRETVRTFGRDGTLSGIISHPERSLGLPVVILGAGIIHKVGPSRALVDVSRGLAEAGHVVLRFDLSGIGDSERASEADLKEAVLADIRDAIDLISKESVSSDGVCLFGFCSGADNALVVARRDERVRAVALFDPSVPKTRGFYRRRLTKRAGSLRSWMNVLSGRALWVRRPRFSTSVVERPPGYYGLLSMTPGDFDATAAELSDRGVAQLYVLSGGMIEHCNSPDQIAESMPSGFRDDLVTVDWRPDFDHILSQPTQREALLGAARKWLAD